MRKENPNYSDFLKWNLKLHIMCDNEAPQTGVFKNDWITLWVLTP